MWINLYPGRPLTQKLAETRMGSGKGSPGWRIANAKPSRVTFGPFRANEKIAQEMPTYAPTNFRRRPDLPARGR